MRFALVILLFPLFAAGQEPRAEQAPLDQVMEKFQAIALDADDDEYRAILVAMRHHGMPLDSGIRRLMNSCRSQAINGLKECCGLSNRGHADVELRVEAMRRDKRKPSYVESNDVLSPELESYATDLFEQKKCRGILSFGYRPNADLVRLDNDIHLSICEGTQKVRDYNYTKHTLVLNEQFTHLTPAIQRALIHLFMCKIAHGEALRDKLLMQAFTARKAPYKNAQECANSPASQKYRESLMLGLIGQCVIDDHTLAAPLAALYNIYECANRSATGGYHGSFYAMHAKCRDWALRLHRFVRANELIKVRKK